MQINIKNTALLFFIMLLGILCKPDLSNPKVEALYTEVIAIHDEVMPKMSTIHKLKKKLKKIENGVVTKVLIDNLDKADEGMMQWMEDFAVFKKMDDKSDEEKIKFLEEEKEKITKVSVNMKSSISIAEAYLNNQQDSK
ncbi:MAG: hypothetical protein HKO66_12455 [Saprospiraceae bacterium]|nr:hypothetical protein [Bacteroidia bacterium]NNE15536.1 hypothetical protein [Saprospiraceae bacterium]NNL93041.1 hypothetical protein [Saprospiraceae bacterium]